MLLSLKSFMSKNKQSKLFQEEGSDLRLLLLPAFHIWSRFATCHFLLNLCYGSLLHSLPCNLESQLKELSFPPARGPP